MATKEIYSHWLAQITYTKIKCSLRCRVLFLTVVIIFKGAAMVCLLLQRRLAKLDESGEQSKGIFNFLHPI